MENVAEKLAHYMLQDERGDQALILLRRLLSQGKLQEDNCDSAFENLVLTMRDQAPWLWSTYAALDDKKARDIAQVAVNKP